MSVGANRSDGRVLREGGKRNMVFVYNVFFCHSYVIAKDNSVMLNRSGSSVSCVSFCSYQFFLVEWTLLVFYIFQPSLCIVWCVRMPCSHPVCVCVW